MVRGMSYTPRPLPPNVIGQPWNNLTIVKITTAAGTNFSVKDVVEFLTKQAGLIGKTPQGQEVPVSVEFRLLEVSTWTEASHLTIYPIDFASRNKVELTRIDSAAAKNAWARAGYRWPASCQAVTISAADKEQRDMTLMQIDISADARTETHFKVLWRSASSASIKNIWIYVPRDPSRSLRIAQPHDAQGDEEVGTAAFHESVCPRAKSESDCMSETASLDDLTAEVRQLREEVLRLRSS